MIMTFEKNQKYFEVENTHKTYLALRALKALHGVDSELRFIMQQFSQLDHLKAFILSRYVQIMHLSKQNNKKIFIWKALKFNF